ncbi:suppressor of fused domain protein [Sphingomonas sp. BT-65]|uniref:suppressor of fused domain protein n=1 Tax=Sphingomonas sp. BT-65 TaxID=2989821 RepID=UPI002236021D|nr:suppressor of fused domain protein [Sphingomonas sp. BT-65]MCW4463032.1 suppressor of fused domain protein [Sphingomonas sp. BT-65]
MGLFDRFRGLFGGAPVAPDSPAHTPEPTPNPALETSQARRDAFWSEVGMVERDVLGHLISPGLLGGPAWPTTRQAYRVVRRSGGAILIATDGMSDPFDGAEEVPPVNGFECELFIEVTDLPIEHAGTPGEIEPVKHSWAFELLTHVAGMIAKAGGAKQQFDHYGVLSMELPGVSRSDAIAAVLPPRFVTADDALGILIGGPAPDFPDRIADMPLSPVRLLPIVILTAAELAEIRAGDEDTREALAGQLGRTMSGHRCDFVRASIVEEAD